MKKAFSLIALVFSLALTAQPTHYRQEMRDFVIAISGYAKNTADDFFIVPQNGIELLTYDGDPEGLLAMDYVNAIDAHGQESLFYGYKGDNIATPKKESKYLSSFLDRSLAKGNTILVTDYCYSAKKTADAYQKNSAKGYVSFRAPIRELTAIPPLEGSNLDPVNQMGDVHNFLYLINPIDFDNKAAFVNALSQTTHDLLIVDLFFGEEQLTKADVAKIAKTKSGKDRLVLCYMSIGEAEDYRYYWDVMWDDSPPDWIAAENPNWEGNFKVKYWHPAWQKLILGTPESYLDKILAAGFNGVYLDIIDAFEYFETQED